MNLFFAGYARFFATCVVYNLTWLSCNDASVYCQNESTCDSILIITSIFDHIGISVLSKVRFVSSVSYALLCV